MQARISTDVALFTVQNAVLKVLLIRRAARPFRGDWALPGGMALEDESLEDCARRELAEETGVEARYLEQLFTFGDVDRDPRGRVISIAYYALMPADDLVLAAATDADAAAWFPVDDLPPLAFDHHDILSMALDRLRAKLDYSTIAFQFLPATFTLTQVQRIYEVISGEPLDKRNFRKLILRLGELEETGEMSRDGPHRPAKLFRLKHPDRVQFIK